MVFKSLTNTIRYLKNSSKTIQNGWLRTDDLIYSSDGYLFIVDGKKAQLLEEKTSPPEVENAIDKHPLVLESCVGGVEDEKFGEIVGAMIYCKMVYLLKKLKGIYNNLAGYKIPKLSYSQLVLCQELHLKKLTSLNKKTSL